MSLTQQPVSTGRTKERGRQRTVLIVCATITVAAVVGIVLLLTRDEYQPVAAEPPPTPSASASSPPEPSPPPQTAQDIAVTEAEDRYREYVRVYDEVAQGGHTNLERYRTVAIDPHLAELFLGARPLMGVRSSGSSELASLTAQAVDLDAAGDYPSVRLMACLDVSQVSAVNASGQNAVLPDRLNRIRSEVTLRHIPAEAFTDGRPAGWYVGELVQPGEPC
jgi:hypothetical protein